MKRILSIAIALQFSVICLGQAPVSPTSADIYLSMRKLNVLGSVLYLAAHPDDENTRLIAWLSKDRLYRTGYLAMTRGDGGQNLIGDEQGIELGLIRTQELLAARRVDGGEQFFTRAFDFGFSKSPQETFTKWDKEKILSDVVWVIRKFQPDVIITRFPTTGEGGHGHHTASAILANEAFTAAADPNRFPEQLKFVKPWQVKRVLWNTFNFGGNNTTAPNQLKIDVGGYNPLLGKSYGEIAAESRSNHKSQGFGSAGQRGEALEYFRTTSGDAPSADIMDGIDLTWQRVKGGDVIAKAVDKLCSSFDFLHPEKSVKGLVELYQSLNAMPDGYWKEQKIKEVKSLIEQCTGLFLDITTNDQYAVQTDSIRFNFQFNNRLGGNAVLKKMSVDGFDSTFNQPLLVNRNVVFNKTFLVPLTKPITQPYWLANKMEEGYFNVSNQQQIGQPNVDPSYLVDITLTIEGQDIVYSKAVKYRFTDPVKGEIYWPLVVIPSYTLKITPEIVLAKSAKADGSVYKDSYDKVFTSYKTNNDVRTTNEELMKSKPGTTLDKIVLNKETRTIAVEESHTIDPGGTSGNFVNYTHDFYDVDTKQPLHDLMKIRYDHIPSIVYFKPSTVTVKDVQATIYNKRIGYIVGAGDKVPEALEQMGYDVTMLDEKGLARNSLQQYDVIMTGVRAYNTNDWMNKYRDKLMKYVNDGGNFIVQYNTPARVNASLIGPYKFDIVNRRVTDENAVVTILKADHPVLNFPNKITQEDFKGWIQERSIYHAANYDSTKFESIFSMHDPNENADNGSLVIARYGKGFFTYTGIVFFRELPAGVPGAYRLMANIIALNRKKAF